MAVNLVMLKPIPNTAVIEALEDALSRAREGRLPNIVMAGWSGDDRLVTWYRGCNRDNLSAVAALQHVVLKSAFEE